MSALERLNVLIAEAEAVSKNVISHARNIAIREDSLIAAMNRWDDRAKTAEARVAELEAALDEATNLLAAVGTEPMDKFRSLVSHLK